jgi:dolichyl-phosphate-mannose-protein mannosyltransferase
LTRQYDAYSNFTPSPSAIVDQTSARPVEAKKPPPEKPQGEGSDKALNDDARAGVSGAPARPDQRVIAREEKVEYRDQDGNLLDEEQVKALEGKVEFRTRYETRTRVVDADGNEIPMPEGGWPDDLNEAGVAPPHPDVDGGDPNTKSKMLGRPDDPIPPEALESLEGLREGEEKKAKPASESPGEKTAKEDVVAKAKDEL